MSKVVKQGPCPRCRERGQDRRGDNLAIYADGGSHCFSCGFHQRGKFQLTFINKDEEPSDNAKTVLPRDTTKEIPARFWKWLLQYGLSYTYWAPYCRYSEAHDRIIFTYGEPVQFAQGRSLDLGTNKWVNYGPKHHYVETLSGGLSGEVVLVEDLISAHKVAQVAPCIPLFGTMIPDIVIKELLRLKRPVALWLDDDQYGILSKKINRLQSLLGQSVRFIHTKKDPKALSLDEIKEVLK
jgi:hypothetical protein